jgi:hypothetical protein
MITKTCLIAGSFVLAPPPLEPEELGFVPFASLPPSPPAAAVVVGAGAGAALAGVAGACAGVGVSSEEGGSLDESVEDDGDDDADAAGGAAAGTMTLTGGREEASVAFTDELAAPPINTPNPRNASTKTAEIRGEGRARPDANPPAGTDAASGFAGCSSEGGMFAERSRMPLSSSSSCALRGPLRAPQSRQ